MNDEIVGLRLAVGDLDFGIRAPLSANVEGQALSLENGQSSEKLRMYPIPGRHVFLRRPEPEDMELFVRLLNDPFVTSSTVEVGMPVSAHDNFSYHQNNQRMDSVHLAVIERASERAVGVTVVQRINWSTQTAEHGMKMDPEFAGRGFATDACMARNAFLFFRLGLRRLILKSLDFNLASQQLALKLGYRLEGREREAVQRDGRWCDVLTYGLLRHEAEAMESYKEYRRLIVPVDVRIRPDETDETGP